MRPSGFCASLKPVLTSECIVLSESFSSLQYCCPLAQTSCEFFLQFHNFAEAPVHLSNDPGPSALFHFMVSRKA